MKHKIVKIASLMLCLVMIAPVVKASSFQKRLHSEIQDLYKIIENNPAALEKLIQDIQKGQHKTTRIQSLKPIQTANNIELFEIIYEDWDGADWIPTHRYLLSSSLLPISSRLSDYELLLFLLVYMLMYYGAEGDIGESIASFAPLLTLHETIFQLILIFEYALHQEREGDTWVDDYKILTQRNLQNQMTEARIISNEDGTWVTFLRTTFTWDLDLISSATIQSVSMYDYILQNILRFDFEHNGSVLQKMTFLRWLVATSAWVKMVQISYNYNSPLLSENLMQYTVTDGATWFDFYQVLYIYDGNDRLSEKLSLSVDLSEISVDMPDPTEPLELLNDKKELFAYDTRDNMIDHSNYYWDEEHFQEDKWVWDIRETYEYDPEDREILRDTYYGNDHYWEPYEKVTSAYSGSLLTQKLYQEWDWSGLVDIDMQTYSYDNSQLSSILYQEKEGNEWVNVMRKLYGYDPETGANKIETIAIPKQYKLQNYPNPFNPSTTIQFDLPKSTFVSLKIFDLLGREITTLIHEKRPAGEYAVEWNGKGLPSGIYLYRLKAGDYIKTRKLVLQK